jgi:hypothetical protein
MDFQNPAFYDFNFKSLNGTNLFYKMEEEYAKLGPMGKDMKEFGINPFSPSNKDVEMSDPEEEEYCPSVSPCANNWRCHDFSILISSPKRSENRLLSYEEAQILLKKANISITNDAFNMLVDYLMKDIECKLFLEKQHQYQQVLKLNNFV